VFGSKRLLVAAVAAFMAFVPARASQPDVGLVTGVVWFDEEHHGVRQPGDPLAPNVRIEAGRSIRPGGVGRSFAETRTDANGRYEFVLPTGTTYIVGLLYDEETGEPPPAGGPPSHRGCALTAIVQPGSVQEINVRLRRDPPGTRSGDDPPSPLSLPLPDGYFFKQAPLQGPKSLLSGCDAGFAVTNAEGIAFWDAFRRWGPEHLGWPISVRFEFEGQVLQVFERAVLEWRPGEERVAVLDVMDQWHELGQDQSLWNSGMVPKAQELDGRPDDPEGVAARLALLDSNPAIRERYFSVDDPIAPYGLPTSAAVILPRRRYGSPEDGYIPGTPLPAPDEVSEGPAIALRTENTVFYQWLEDTQFGFAPLAVGAVGEVTIAQTGRYAGIRGWYPAQVFVRQPVPPGAGPNTPLW
jgi:hypothetical protein